MVIIDSPSDEHMLTKGIARLVLRLKEESELSSKTVGKILDESRIEESDLIPYAVFDHSPDLGYGRKLVHRSDTCEIMVMTWCANDMSAIHDHGYTQWGAVQVFGRALHQMFSFYDNRLSKGKTEWLEDRQIIRVYHFLIHQMANSSAEKILSLHVYGVNDSCSGITDNARIFDVIHQQVFSTTGGAFIHLAEGQEYTQPNKIEIDETVLAEQARLMLPYLQRLSPKFGNDLILKLSSSLRQLAFRSGHAVLP